MIRKLLAALLSATLLATPAYSQSSPGWSQGYVPTAGEWNNAFASKQDALNFTPLNSAGGTMTGKLLLAPSNTSAASLNFALGVAPSVPNDGDVWRTSLGLYYQSGASLIGPIVNNTIGVVAPIVNNIIAGVQTLSIANGVSVANPGTGTLESILPVITVTATSKADYDTNGFFKKVRRSNGGVAMTDTFPASTATGLINGTRIIVANFDATASITITAGAGTSMPTGATDVIGPQRDVSYEYDTNGAIWRPAYNTRIAVLGPNNGSDFSNLATVRTNIFPANTATLSQLPQIPARAILGNASAGTANVGSGYSASSATDVTLAAVHGAVVTSDLACWNDTVGTLKDCGTAGVASFNGRGGSVVPAAGDYNTNQLTTNVSASPPAAGKIGELVKQSMVAKNTASVTFTNASPSITWTANGLAVGDVVFFTTTGALPTNFAASTNYYVVSATTNTITVSATPGGAAIVAGSAGSGTQSGFTGPLLVTSVMQDVIALSLTAGDWRCAGSAMFVANTGTTITGLGGQISLSSNTSLGNGAPGFVSFASNFLNASTSTIPLPDVDFTFNATTNVFLDAFASFGTSTMVAGGYIACRRQS